MSTMRANGDFVQSPVPNAQAASFPERRSCRIGTVPESASRQKLSEMDALRWARNLLFLLPVGLGCRCTLDAKTRRLMSGQRSRHMQAEAPITTSIESTQHLDIRIHGTRYPHCRRLAVSLGRDLGRRGRQLRFVLRARHESRVVPLR